MVSSAVERGVITPLIVETETLIDAPMEVAFEALLEELGPANEGPAGSPMPMVLEAMPGGRWYRDLGKSAGHFWGVVQVIKPPTLLEITGPLFMSYPCINHVQYRLASEGLGTRLKLIHRGLGDFEPAHREGVASGWRHLAERTKRRAESRK